MPLCPRFRPLRARRDLRHIDGETIRGLMSQGMTAVMPVAAPPRTETPSRPGGRETDLRARAAAALLACTARHGLAKTTLDDVAREAGCARASLYRHFGGKR